MNSDRRSERRPSADRRQQHEFRLAIPRELREGWLALQGQEQRLRLTPIPDGWVHLTDDELCRLVLRAANREQSRAS
jgi:hypothetical protein